MPFSDQTALVRYIHPEWPVDYWLDFKAHMTQGDVEVITKSLYTVAVDIKTKQVSMMQAGHSARRLLFMQMLRGISPRLRREVAVATDVAYGSDSGALYDALSVPAAQHLGDWLSALYEPKDDADLSVPAVEQTPAREKPKRKPKPKSRVDALEF